MAAMADAVSGLHDILQQILEYDQANKSVVSALLPAGDSLDAVKSSLNSRKDVRPAAVGHFSKESSLGYGAVPQVSQLQQRQTLFAATSPQQWLPAQSVPFQPPTQTVGGFAASQAALLTSNQAARGSILSNGNFSTPPPGYGAIPQLQHWSSALTVPPQTARGVAAFSAHRAPPPNLGSVGPLCSGQSSFDSASVHSRAAIFEPVWCCFSLPPPAYGSVPPPSQFQPQQQWPQAAPASLQLQMQSAGGFPSYSGCPPAVALVLPNSSNLQKQQNQSKEAGHGTSRTHYRDTSHDRGAKRNRSRPLTRRNADTARKPKQESSKGMAASNVHISALDDPDLAQIFKHLPPFDRLRVSEVCKRWWSVSRDPWREVTHLEFTESIPSESIGAIARKCPNLTSLFCHYQMLILDDLRDITLASFKSMELHGCIFISHDDQANKTALPLFRSEHGQSMEELILYEHTFDMGDECELSERYSQQLLPVSLKRLQLSVTVLLHDDSTALSSYLIEMRQLRHLECLILHKQDVCLDDNNDTLLYNAIRCLKTLRELLISPDLFEWWVLTDGFLRSVMDLPNLEILVLSKSISRFNFPGLFIEHPSLRLLVIADRVYATSPPTHVPVRNRFPRGFSAKPLPCLHVFVSKSAAEAFIFDDSPSNGLKVHPINAPFPELLEEEEIRELFEDSWMARQIKAGAKRGVQFWNYKMGLVEST